jgi:hypothetical protein
VVESKLRMQAKVIIIMKRGSSGGPDGFGSR